MAQFAPKNKNFLSPVGFKFIMSRTPNVDYFCQSASIPEVSIGTREISTPVKDYTVPGDKMTFGDLNLRFLVNEDLDNYFEIYKWLKGLTNPKNTGDFQAYINSVDEKGRDSDFTKSMSDARLLVLNSNYNGIATVNFYNIFPTSLTTLEFDASATDINYFTAEVNFKYTIYEITDKDQKKVNLETLNDMWEKDSPLDDEKLDHDSLSIPKLHAKYLRLYNNFTTLRDQAELEVKRTYRDRWEYYTGKSEKPFPMKLIKTDVAIYLEADQEYQKSVLKAKYLNQMVEAIKTILSAISNRSFHIKNAVEFAKFLKGYEI